MSKLKHGRPVETDQQTLIYIKELAQRVKETNTTTTTTTGPENNVGYVQVMQPETVNHPKHCKPTKNAIEPLEYIRSHNMDFLTGNIIKYVSRAKHKGKELEDLKKAKFYLDELIKEAEEKFKPKITHTSNTGEYLIPYTVSSAGPISDTTVVY